MGKKAKEHRRKVEKRNKKIEHEKQMMKRQIDKLFEQRLSNVDGSDINVKLGDTELPFSVVEDSGIFPNTKLNDELKNLDFTDSNNNQEIEIEVSSTEDNNGTTGSI
jgi:hypothetical protein